MSLGGTLTVVFIQLAVLLAPLGVGLAGMISGAIAGLLSVSAWFVVGIPLSYAFVDRRASRRAPGPHFGEPRDRPAPANDPVVAAS